MSQSTCKGIDKQLTRSHALSLYNVQLVSDEDANVSAVCTNSRTFHIRPILRAYFSNF